jgi:hypothetical protein
MVEIYVNIFLNKFLMIALDGIKQDIQNKLAQNFPTVNVKD